MLTIGVDSHLESYVAVAIDATAASRGSIAVASSRVGRQQLRDWAAALSDQEPRQWGIEGSGSYGRALAQELAITGEPVFEVPGLATARERGHSLGRQRDKTDATDALAIARVTLREAGRLPRVGAVGAAHRCKLLTEHRDNLVLQRTRVLNQLYVHLAALERCERGAFRATRGRRQLATLARLRVSGPDPVVTAHAAIIRQLATLTQQYDRLIDQITADLQVLAVKTVPSLLTLRGVGGVTAAKILAETGDVSRFPTAAHFASYCGVAPIEASSGDRRRHRLSRRGNRQLNYALYTVAVTQRRWHPEAQAYLERKVAAGKSRKEALRALKRHLANVVFRLLCQDALAERAAPASLEAAA